MSKKARKTMKAGYDWYRHEGHKLSPSDYATFESLLQALDQALLQGDKQQAKICAKKVEEFCNTHFKKSLFNHAKELTFALTFALIVAIVVRAIWFELYEIPTGSMRPTYQEKDDLTVSKTQFGINIPLMAGHFYFDPNEVKRTGDIIFLADNLPIEDATSYYFNVLPYTKRFIKRLIAKPGDTIYFYGGKLYGIDKDNKPIEEYHTAPWMKPLSHIPFLTFEGRPSMETHRVVIKQMNLPVARILDTPFGIRGEVYNGTEWILDQPTSKKHDTIQTYSDLWGIGNYAMVRMTSPNQIELNHTPRLTAAPYKTTITLQPQHREALLKNMNTTRFVVENGRARNFNNLPSKHDPALPGVPDGTYQFDHGVAQQVGFGAILYNLSPDHPLYKPELLQTLFNMGVEFNTLFEHNLFPMRYAYFRDGDLYLLDAPIFKKDDSTLIEFKQSEQQRESQGGYIAFRDHGAPDINTIQTFGLKIPPKQYLVLGDNYAVSADSRVMGFIPEDNLHGVPDVLLWPPGKRWPYPEGTPYPQITRSRLFVWTIAAIVAVIASIITIKRRRRPIFVKIAADKRVVAD